MTVQQLERSATKRARGAASGGARADAPGRRAPARFGSTRHVPAGHLPTEHVTSGHLPTERRSRERRSVERSSARRRPPNGRPPSAVLPSVRAVVACPQNRQAGYRLGRWARLTLTSTVVAVALLLATGVVGGDGRSASDAAVVVTAPGDTLWSVAADAAGGSAVGTHIDTLRSLNHLEGWAADAELPVGMTLSVPYVG